MNKFHRLEFPVLRATEKKEIKTIYIDADEDYVSLQYLEHKGDIKRPRTNTVMPKIIYVYEGVDTDNDDVNREFLGLEQDYATWDEDTLFHPDNISVSEASRQREEKKPLTSIVKTDSKDVKEEDYLAEIDELRRKLNQRDMEYKQLRSQYAALNSAKKESDNFVAKYQNDREELIALREFAYRLEQEVPEIPEVGLDEMKATIADKAFVIVGGHVNWVNKLKTEFPKWSYVLPSAYKTVDASSLENKDMIFFLYGSY